MGTSVPGQVVLQDFGTDDCRAKSDYRNYCHGRSAPCQPDGKDQESPQDQSCLANRPEDLVVILDHRARQVPFDRGRRCCQAFDPKPCSQTENNRRINSTAQRIVPDRSLVGTALLMPGQSGTSARELRASTLCGVRRPDRFEGNEPELRRLKSRS